MPVARQLLLYRHAKSDRSDASLEDYDRPLNGRGRSAAPRMGKAMRAMGLSPDLVLCSTSARTQGTLLLTLNQLGWGRRVRMMRALYLAEWPAILAILREQPEEAQQIMVVGHNPGLEQLGVQLCVPDRGDVEALERLRSKFPTGALAVLGVECDWSALAPETAVLQTLLTPSEAV